VSPKLALRIYDLHEATFTHHGKDGTSLKQDQWDTLRITPALEEISASEGSKSCPGNFGQALTGQNKLKEKVQVLRQAGIFSRT
jgi:hypothetical protein